MSLNSSLKNDGYVVCQVVNDERKGFFVFNVNI